MSKFLLSESGLAGFCGNSVFQVLKNHYFFPLKVDALCLHSNPQNCSSVVVSNEYMENE